ncbi:MAG: glycosyltransferase family 4 protein [Synechococcus sp.]
MSSEPAFPESATSNSSDNLSPDIADGTSSAPNAAVYYRPDGYSTTGKRLLGRQSAGEEFLKAMARFGRNEHLVGCMRNQQEFMRFAQQVGPHLAPGRKPAWIPEMTPQLLERVGIIYRPDPMLGPMAWRRRHHSQRAYSLCGVTHTIASQPVMAAIGDLCIAPLQTWDAIICTSQAVKTTIERLLGHWMEYLGDRLGASTFTMPQLPVIPLGVDLERFQLDNDLRKQKRQQWRHKLGIEPDDIVVLFVGRLNFYSKAHPLPMYLALERVANQTDRRIHFVQVGWFENAAEESDFQQAAQTCCLKVNSIFLDGRDPQVRSEIWAAADIFLSLSDNIQETFGLTPIEAMAAGLPVVISDWNGYRESVREGVDGFKVPTYTPSGGAELDWAEGYLGEVINYSTYIGYSCMSVAVDVEAATAALLTLVEEPQLRESMATAGRNRAQEYSWPQVIRAYEDLWGRLNQLRQSGAESAAREGDRPPFPLLDDPSRVFEHYSTAAIAAESQFELGGNDAFRIFTQLEGRQIVSLGWQQRLQKTVIQTILQSLQTNPSQSLEELQAVLGLPESETGVLSRSLAYLLKFGLIRINSDS